MHIHLEDWSFRCKHFAFSALTCFSYTLDLTVYLLILVLFMIFGTYMEPRYHEFLVEDISLQYSYKAESETAVTMLPLIMISVVFPISQFLACSLLSRYAATLTRKIWDAYAGMLALLGSMATQLMVTCILKNICGLPRPDVLDRCQLIPEISEDLKLVTVEACENYSREYTTSMAILQEGFRSFPSGHLSTIFCGMVITSLNIAAKLQVFDKRGISFKVLLALLPLMVACFVSCTRISDNRHFLRDVIGGSLIGATIGVWFYLQYFPSVFNLENSGRAYPPRRIGVAKYFNNIGGFWKMKEVLPGSYTDRVLNTPDISRQLEEQVNESFSPSELEDLVKNISIVNKISHKLKNKFLDLGLEKKTGLKERV